MKHLTRIALAMLLVTAFAATAHADWNTVPVMWKHWGLTESNAATFSGLRGWMRDTTYIPMAAAKVDTSAAFSLEDVDMITNLDFGRTATTGDSVASAYVVLVADSSVASSVNWKDTSVKLQVNYGQGAGWQDAQSWALLMTDGQKVMPLPIWQATATITNDLPINLASPSLLYAPSCRVIVTGGTSVAAPQTRIFIRKYQRKT